MKKKLIYVIWGIIVVVALAVMLIFALSGDITTKQQEVNIFGTWRVVSYVNNGVASLVEDEFIVFNGEQAFLYRDNNNKPYASSLYEIDASLLMELPEISRKYTIEPKSENHIRLYESAEIYLYLIRYPNENMSAIEVDNSVVTGKWNVTYRDTAHPIENEYLVFEDGKMLDYRNNDETPVATMEYTWNQNDIVIPTINKTMVLHIISENEIVFIETDTGFIWELKKAE